jgi:hypothetical protein
MHTHDWLYSDNNGDTWTTDAPEDEAILAEVKAERLRAALQSRVSA